MTNSRLDVGGHGFSINNHAVYEEVSINFFTTVADLTCLDVCEFP